MYQVAFSLNIFSSFFLAVLTTKCNGCCHSACCQHVIQITLQEVINRLWHFYLRRVFVFHVGGGHTSGTAVFWFLSLLSVDYLARERHVGMVLKQEASVILYTFYSPDSGCYITCVKPCSSIYLLSLFNET